MSKTGNQLRTRKSLKMIFQKGKLPTESNFGDLIDSVVNILDDGINKSEKFGYEISPQGQSESLLSFFENAEDSEEPIWQFLARDGRESKDISFGNKAQKNTLYFSEDGKIGVHTENPTLPLTVNGFVGMKGRMGSYQIANETTPAHITVQKTAKADGKYHNIITGIKNTAAFEIIAKANGPAGRGKQAMTHAIAVCTDWTSFFNKISYTNAFSGWPWNKIKLRWKKNSRDKSLSLQIKTRSHFGINRETDAPFKIKFHITSLWEEAYVDELS